MGQPSRVYLAQLFRRIMILFFKYWIEVLKLTKDQAYRVLYRFVRFSAGTKEDDVV